ncbi:MAG: phenylalanine--tRNA ligase subunit beta, partial [Bacteroidota bacterium]
MKLSYNWLREYVDIPFSPTETARILTDTGLEVEGETTVESIPGGLKGLVVGQIKTVVKHPQADRLNLTTVDLGDGEPVPIVCGAPNVAEGHKVVVAPVGTEIHPLSGESFKIKKAKIRGEASQGMICAEDEVGLGEDHDGIIVLPEDAPVGMAVRDFLNVETDTVFDIGLTPNRADAASHIGAARDLVAALRVLHNQPAELKWPDVSGFQAASSERVITVEVEDTEACPRYAGLTITGVQVGPSPDWLQQRLTAIGLKPINNVVDVTNFVLHEFGQPLHAFDADQIVGDKVIVRKLPQDTAFVTLDEVERKLADQDLMICNAEGGMCIAGVFGGLRSGVTDQTTAIFLESAYFNPVSVRKTAKRHGLNTDASFRFERGVDPANTVLALQRAAQLILETAGGTIASPVIDHYPQPVKDFQVTFRYAQCDRLAGQVIERETIRKILEALEITITSASDTALELRVPAFKVDVQREVDVIEEVLRIYGFNRIALPDKLHTSVSHRAQPDGERLLAITSEYLAANGFREILANSLTRSAYYRESALVAEETLVELSNPLSSELDVLRPAMVFSGLEAIAYNRNRKQEDLRFFELGATYHRTGSEGYREERCLSLYLTGRQQPEHWRTKDAATDFFHLRGFVDGLLERLGVRVRTQVLPEAS